MQTRRRKCQKTDTRVFLLDLPDGAVESIASFLQPVAMAQLQSACRQLRSLLSQDRLWHVQLQQSYPFWTSAGIYPVCGRKDGETWKQLVSTAYGIKLPEPEVGQVTVGITLNCHIMISDTWDNGKDRVALDCYLCYAETRSGAWSFATAQPYFKKEHTVLLLDLVYFLWFEERQLCRGAKMLAKGLYLLADLAKVRGFQQQPLWHTDVDVAMAASSAGSYLIDLLQLRVAHLSPLAITAPQAFLQACSGQGSQVASGVMADKIEWCGGEYDVADLKAALAVVLSSGTPQDQLLAREYSDPWAPNTWKVLGDPAQSLLRDLAQAQAQAAFNAHNEWELPGAVLLSKAEAMSELSGELKPSRMCKAHHLFAGATLLLRMYFRQDKGKGVTVHAEHGLMYEDARQHQRAAYYYKQAILLGCQTSDSELDYNVDSVLVGIAEAYDGEWQDTGSIKSFQKAFEWRKFLVQRLLGKADKTPALFERTCECLQSLGLLLEDHSCRGGTTPQLQGCDSHLLAVGAYMTGMRQIDANSAIMAWLQSHIQMADAAEKAFTAFIEDDHVALQPEYQQASVIHLPLGLAAASDAHTHTDSSHPTQPARASFLHPTDPTASAPSQTAGPQSRPASHPQPSPAEATLAEASTTTDTEASPTTGTEAAPATSPEAHPAPRTATGTEAPPCTATGSPAAHEEGASSSRAAAQVSAAPPVELTLKHVGFLGSLAHALVHLQQPSQGLALLRAAASVMRTNTPHPSHWFQGFPDPRPLHAHVLMDLGVSLLGERLYEEALDVFMEGLVIAERQRLGDRVLSTFHDHVAHTILQLRQQRAVHDFNLTNGDRMEISWRHAEEHAMMAITLGRQCKPPEAALEASPLTTMGDIASAMCHFPIAKQRYMEAYERLAGSDSPIEALSASNAAEAATTLAAVADMMLKMGEEEEATRSLTTSLDLLKQHPGQLPALQVKRTQLYLTTLQMQIHIYKGDLAGAKQQLDTCMGLTHTGAEYRPGFIRYDEAIMAAARGNAELALQQFQEATEIARQQQDRQLETMAATAVGLLLTSPGQQIEQQEVGWKVLQEGMGLAVRVGDRLCEAHAAEGMLKALACDGFGRRFKNKRELKRSLQDQVAVISKDIGQAAIDASRRMLSFAGL